MDANPSDTNPEDAIEHRPSKKEKPRVLSAEVLPSDRHPFQIHFEVVKRFVTLSHNGNQPIEASRVEGEGIPVQAGSLNVRFFKVIGLITAAERGLYLPTQEAMRLVSARSVSDEKARPIMRKLLEGKWFVETARSYLNPTEPVNEGVFLGELAIAAQTDKEKKEPALRVIVDYLEYAGIVIRAEAGLLLAPDQVAGRETDNVPATVAPVSPQVQAQSPAVSLPSMTPGNSGWHVVQTEDFFLKIKPDLMAIQDLGDHLDLIRRKITRSQGETAGLNRAMETSDKKNGSQLREDSARE